MSETKFRPVMICVGHSQMNVNPPGFDILHVVWESNGIPMPWKSIDYPWGPMSGAEEELANYIKSNLEECYNLAVSKLENGSWILRMQYPTNISAGRDNDSETCRRLMEIYKPVVEMWINNRK